MKFPSSFYEEVAKIRHEGLRVFQAKILANLEKGSYPLFLECWFIAGASRLLSLEETVRRGYPPIGQVQACGYVWDLEGAFLPEFPSIIPLAPAKE